MRIFVAWTRWAAALRSDKVLLVSLALFSSLMAGGACVRERASPSTAAGKRVPHVISIDSVIIVNLARATLLKALHAQGDTSASIDSMPVLGYRIIGSARVVDLSSYPQGLGGGGSVAVFPDGRSKVIVVWQ